MGGRLRPGRPAGWGSRPDISGLHQGFYRSVLPDSEVQLGRAILAAKLDLHAYTEAYDELLDTYHLFGDPAMVLNTTLVPWPHLFYLPVIFGDSMGG